MPMQSHWQYSYSKRDSQLLPFDTGTDQDSMKSESKHGQPCAKNGGLLHPEGVQPDRLDLKQFLGLKPNHFTGLVQVEEEKWERKRETDVKWQASA